jgi:hypothetical protein
MDCGDGQAGQFRLKAFRCIQHQDFVLILEKEFLEKGSHRASALSESNLILKAESVP